MFHVVCFIFSQNINKSRVLAGNKKSFSAKTIKKMEFWLKMISGTANSG